MNSASSGMVFHCSTLADQNAWPGLWEKHRVLANGNRIVYYLPRDLGSTFHNDGTMAAAAQHLSLSSHLDISAHYHVVDQMFRLGQVNDEKDEIDVAGAILLFKINYKDVFDRVTARGNHIIHHSYSAQAHGQSVVSHGGTKIAKPLNYWILYRRSVHARVKSLHPNLHESQISKIISDMWAAEPEEERKKWATLAEQEKKRHAAEHPNYKLTPRKSSQIKKRKKTVTKVVIQRVSGKDQISTKIDAMDSSTLTIGQQTMMAIQDLMVLHARE